MVSKSNNVTDAELSVLQVLWSMGLATIREIRDQLYPNGDTSEYATVQKLLERLEAKKFVRRSRDSIPHTFVPRVDRDELVGRRLADLADTLCEGSLAPIISHLVRLPHLNKRDRQHLQELSQRLGTLPGKTSKKDSRGTRRP